MIPALKSEFRKLLTVRSTYVIALIAFSLVVFVALYIEGYRNGLVNTAGPGGAYFLANSITQHANLLSLFCAIAALLLMTHEYRYGIISYSLTITNHRSKVLAAKFVVVTAYTIALVVAGTALALGCMIVGLHWSGQSLPAQHIDLLGYVIKSLVYCEGWALTGLLLATLIRNQVGALAVLFIVPNTVEGLLSLILKENSAYLPFTALSQVIKAPVVEHAAQSVTGLVDLTPLQAGLLFLAYIFVAWVVAWWLFLKRDAN